VNPHPSFSSSNHYPASNTSANERSLAAIVGLVGVLVTWVFVPNLQGEDLALEDEKFRSYLVKHGWDGVMGEEDLKAFADAGIPPALMQEEGKFGGVPDLVTEREAHLRTG
jgi:hypothetical protein